MGRMSCSGIAGRTGIAMACAAFAALPVFAKGCDQSTLSRALRTCDWEAAIHLEVAEKENPPELADVDLATAAAYVDDQCERGKADSVVMARSLSTRLVSGGNGGRSDMTFSMKWKGKGGLASAIARNRRGTHQLVVKGNLDPKQRVLVGQWRDIVEVLGTQVGGIEVRFFFHENRWYGVARWRKAVRDFQISRIERGWFFRVKS